MIFNMTQEEKAKAYDEALKEAVIAHKDEDRHLKATLERIFPELRESEDERIRKSLIDMLKNDEKCYLKEIAWLEKQGKIVDYYEDRLDECACKYFNKGYKHALENQGEPTDINPSEFDLRLNKLLKQFETLPKEELANSLSFYLNIVQNNGTYKDEEKQCEQKSILNVPSREVILSIWDLGNEWKELTNGYFSIEYGTQLDYIQKHWQESEYYLRAKQGEQKETLCDKCKKEQPSHFCQDITALGRCAVEHEQTPADTVEPKFNVGDWVVTDKNNVVQIKAIEDSRYVLENAMKFSVCYVDKCWRKWTIQDAKDGDVLVCNNNPFLFLKYEKDEYGLVCCSYCGISDSDYGEFLINTNTKKYWCDIEFAKPATKEQCYLLFAKMKEAGYEWDAEKKELKKIEPIDEYEGLTDFERTLADICIGWIGKEIGWKQYIKDNADVLLKIAVEKFNSIQDVPFEQKPTDEEMKEALRTEYEKIRESLLEYLHTLPNHYTHGGVCVLEWIAWLEKQGEQKPAWSEEDEEIKNFLIALVEWSKSYASSGVTADEAKTALNWLKSLKDRVQPKDILHRTHTIFDQII